MTLLLRKLTKPWRRPEDVPALTRPARLLILGNSASALGSGLAMPYFAIFLLGVRGGATSAVGALATISVVDIVGQWILASPLQRRLGSRLPAVAGSWTQAAGWALLALSSAPWQVFACAAVIGLGNALFFSVRTNLQMEVVAEASHAYSFSLRYLIGNIGMTLGGVLGGATVAWLGGERGPQVLMLANAGTFALFAVLLTTAIAPDRPAAQPSDAEPQPDGETERTSRRGVRPLGLIAAYFLLVTAGLAQFEAVLPLQLTTHGDMAPWMVGYLFSAFALSTVVLQMPVSRLSSRLGGVRSIHALAAAWIAGVLILQMQTDASQGLQAVAIVAGVLVLAFGECFFSPAIPRLLKTDDTELRRRTGTLVSSAHSLGQFAGPSIGIILVTHTTGGLYALVGCGAALAAVLVRQLSPLPRKVIPTPTSVA
ncbi:MFS transporter [Kitasatospora cineracea]|uniref:MFS transporter n=1 Tax=Kitasatospora cineracea TaxID=88074 RepID=UPI0033C3915A